MGTTIYVEGQLQTRKWTDQSGQEKYTTEIVLQRYRGALTMLGGRGQGDDQAGAGNRSQQAQDGGTQGFGRGANGGGFDNSGRAHPDLDDDIPF